MALVVLKNFFCCCETSKDDTQDLGYDESSRLIPPTIDESPQVIYSHITQIDYKKLQERLSDVVRAKEGKMVNVASQIPFNLHNQVLPEPQQSVSRSTSRSFDGQHDRRRYADYSDFSPYRDSDRRRQRDEYGTLGNIYGRRTTSRSLSPSNLRAAGSSIYPYRSDVVEHARPTPILNVRLVGYTDTQYRGRTRERGLVPSGIPSSMHHKAQLQDESSMATPTRATFSESNNRSDNEQVPIGMTSKVFKLIDVSPMTVSWGD
ncbi:hypothetical protein JR316_0004204 [Psilocybe cubensis]|uniref:Uncharacterized protein n=2 Tax=Psilocybe cubensis TaxID=181762 RepID=A0ACB8H2N5_PSICU|nr:hypothetical protein JR316_0004204 [Psilocybe cubensis]KAH9482109.1 hypothetical protein JR316_0004204 [Psilocybe cubensis]